MKNLIFLVIIIGMFTVGCSSFMIEGLLLQISQTIGQPIAVTAQGITFFSLAYFLSAPLCPILFSNKSAKLIIQFALIVFLLGNVITLISKTIVLFLIGMFLTGIGTGVFTPLCVTVAVNYSSISERGRVLSLVWGANSAGVVFGIPFGLYLSTLLNWQLSIAYIITLGLLVLIGFLIQDVEIEQPASPPFGAGLRLLFNQEILLVIATTCFISMACLGLYSYVSSIQSGASYSLVMTVFAWGLGSFVGSSVVGIFIDFTKKPKVILALLLTGLILTFITIPYTKHLPYLGLIPYFMWGALGWATNVVQQDILFELQSTQKTILSALNTSAIGLGSTLGTAVGGFIIASGLEEIYLSFFVAALLIIVLISQLMLVKNSTKEYIT